MVITQEKNWDSTIESITNFSQDDKQTINQLVNSLIEKGYIIVKKDAFIIKETPSKSNQTNDNIENQQDIDNDLPFDGGILVENNTQNISIESLEANKPKSKKLNLFDKCANEIKTYTEDIELRNLLFDYLNLRLNPPSGSRFENNKMTAIQFKYLVQSLDNLQCDKKDSVRQSIDKQYFKFFEAKSQSQTKAFDGVVSNSYTPEEIERLRQRQQRLNDEAVF